jgi:hypothetical protein
MKKRATIEESEMNAELWMNSERDIFRSAEVLLYWFDLHNVMWEIFLQKKLFKEKLKRKKEEMKWLFQTAKFLAVLYTFLRRFVYCVLWSPP